MMDVATLLRHAADTIDLENGGIPPLCVRCHGEWEDEGQGDWGDPVCESCPHHSCAHYDFENHRAYYPEDGGSVLASCIQCGKRCLYTAY
jgi:hypothetical protein